MKYTYYGDSNLSGNVDSMDFTAMLAGYGLASGGKWATGDYNYDDKVNTLDFDQARGELRRNAHSGNNAWRGGPSR